MDREEQEQRRKQPDLKLVEDDPDTLDSVGELDELEEGSVNEEDSLTDHTLDYGAETAAEIAPNAGLGAREGGLERGEESDDMASTEMEEQRGMGVIGIVVSILSLFFMPILLGIAGIVLGFIARRSGANGLGNTAIVIGAFSVIASLFFTPFV
ncbi:DUF4190 domain-containing protein [Texcoconibacillus texcoconensis]|uniref:DUF4190 domain-containing protein n=1 Tax=Texcoconibacillus texcoconensis TaxID=1095777 RepID=A0A840QRB2_9BACI|nr:DUF4190 domain-containing protein [Texcoconibacillus texcoconensis]MBB5173904.1 hypothetical protein [Texcoconibacillus texcoconensis]